MSDYVDSIVCDHLRIVQHDIGVNLVVKYFPYACLSQLDSVQYNLQLEELEIMRESRTSCRIASRILAIQDTHLVVNPATTVSDIPSRCD